MQNSKIGYINGLRAMAIFMVLAHHLIIPISEPYRFSQSGIFNYFFVQPLIYNGWVGVNIFFVLSGFVLYLPYTKENQKKRSTRDFYIRRAKRLLPLYYANIIICIVILSGSSLINIAKYSIFYLFALFPSPLLFYPPQNPPLWSLGIEIWFSIFFPIILLAIYRIGSTARVLLALVACSTLFHAAGSVLLQEQGKFLNDLADTLPGRLSDFCIGMLAASLWARSSARMIHPLALLFLALAFFYLGLIISTSRYLNDLPPILQSFANLAISTATAMAIIALKDRDSTFIPKAFLEIRFIQIIGKMCFSIYIWHWQIIQLFDLFFSGPEWVLTPYLLVYFVTLAAVSVFSYRFIEFPTTDYRAIFLLRPRSAA